MRRSRALLVGTAVAAGLGLGWLAAWHRLERHRSDLFHLRPLRRLAALAWLEGQASVGTLHVLRDYLSWERHPVLRHRAGRLLARLEATLA
jgi:hypothetical protein